MASTNAGKPRKQKVISKLCVKCGKVHPLSHFYANKSWAAQSYHDVWCKDCAAALCVSKDGAREYCWYNNRYWSDAIWEMAMKKAMYALANDDAYLRASAAKRRDMEDKMAGRYTFSIINLSSVYRYEPNISEDGVFREFVADSEHEALSEKDEVKADAEKMVFSAVWNGSFTQREIDYLDDYYAKLEDGFV